MPAGVYVAADGTALPDDYTLEVDDDAATVVESFTQDGKAYVVKYGYVVEDN